MHPQPETYWGHVNPIGPRGVYDEAKRFAEAITMAYHRHHGVPVRIVRIFNTYGPQMRVDDGRSVSNFLVQALRGEPITVFGDGSQTRSFCYVDDEVRGFLALLDGEHTGPINIGNPNEYTIRQLAEMAVEVTDSSSTITYEPLPVDDPTQRQPDLTLARSLLGLGARDPAPRGPDAHGGVLRPRPRRRRQLTRPTLSFRIGPIRPERKDGRGRCAAPSAPATIVATADEEETCKRSAARCRAPSCRSRSPRATWSAPGRCCSSSSR